jgi:alpha-galactosidase
MRRLLALLALTAVTAACGGAGPAPSAEGSPPAGPGGTTPGPAGTPSAPGGGAPGGQPAAPPPAPIAGNSPRLLAPTPPMGWNDWSHYQCWIDEGIILDNARALVASGLAARGYDTVTVDDCWMTMSRDAAGDLVADPQKFPHGMRWLGEQLHGMGLKYGIYEDAGYKTCGEYPGSGQPAGGGPDHFAQDARLFASWGVDYLKLDGCFLWVPPGKTMEQAYRDAYAAQSAALAATGRDIVFSESAPAYFQHRGEEWQTVLGWVGEYGQLWRVGEDIQIHDAWDPSLSRWASVMNNYRYTRDLARFQKPGQWNDPDFIIGGDPGLTFAESQSQMTVWAMLSAPLILSSDLTKVTRSPELVAMLGNREVIAVDQDALGEPAAVVQAGAALDVLVKRLANGDRALAVLNHGATPATFQQAIDVLGFPACDRCTYQVRDLWSGAATDRMAGTLASHASALFRVTQVR